MNKISNTFFKYSTDTSNNIISIKLTKSVDKSTVTIGDIITFTITIDNLSNVDILNATLYEDDLLPEEQYINNSLTINNNNMYINSFPYAGINIGVISAQTTSIISYQVIFNELPSTTELLSAVVASYNYIDDNGNYQSNSISSDINTVIIRNIPTTPTLTDNCPNQPTVSLPVSNPATTTAIPVITLPTMTPSLPDSVVNTSPISLPIITTPTQYNCCSCCNCCNCCCNDTNMVNSNNYVSSLQFDSSNSTLNSQLNDYLNYINYLKSIGAL